MGQTVDATNMDLTKIKNGRKFLKKARKHRRTSGAATNAASVVSENTQNAGANFKNKIESIFQSNSKLNATTINKMHGIGEENAILDGMNDYYRNLEERSNFKRAIGKIIHKKPTVNAETINQRLHIGEENDILRGLNLDYRNLEERSNFKRTIGKIIHRKPTINAETIDRRLGIGVENVELKGMGDYYRELENIGKLKKAAKYGAIGLGVLAGAALLAYLIKHKKDNVETEMPDNKDNTKFPVETTDPTVQKPEIKTGNAVVTKFEEAQYHTISNKGLMWADIVNAYYPGLVEQCDGKMYGANGAIRQLKLALSKDTGIDLINETAIPATLNLPLEINGVKINKDAVPTHSKCKQGGHTNIKEAGAKTTKTMYKVVDEENNAEIILDKYPDVIDSLKVRTGVDEYKVKADTLSVVA